MNNKNTAFMRVKRILVFPFIALWTVITGDSGATALFVNDIAKETKEIDEQDIRNMTN